MSDQEMLALDPLVDNAETRLEDVYKKIIPECEEVRIATGYFYVSGFDLYKDDLTDLLDPDDCDHAPLGRVRRVFHYEPSGDEVNERPVRTLRLTPDAGGIPIIGETSRVLADRESDRYDLLTEWPPEELPEALQRFVDEHVDASAEYQETPAKESEVRARLLCWGVGRNGE